MKRALLVGMGLVLVGGVVTPVVAPTGADSASAVPRAAMPFDFDGDGYADLAAGVPGENLRGKRNPGAVQVLYGSASGVTAHDQLWHQGRKGVKGALEKGDRFGAVLASGDFDADGYADLAIAIPEENIKTRKDTGAVQVLYGSRAGLTAAGDQVWHQGSKGVPGSNGKEDRFGSSLAVGDFDGNGYADLAVGVPGEDVGDAVGAGRVVMLRGSASGLTSARAQSWGEGSAGVASKPRRYEHFGRVIAAGDVNADGRDDLAISVGQVGDSSVHLLLGSPTGFTASGAQFFSLGDLGLGEYGATGAVASLWLGDVNADGHDDLTLGRFRGGVAVLHGHPDGLHPGPLAAPGQPGTDTIWSGYESPAMSGDVTGDGYADLILRPDPAPGGVAPVSEPAHKIGIVIGASNGLGSEVTLWPNLGLPYALNVLPFSGGTDMWLALGDLGGDSRRGGSVTVLHGTSAGTPGPATVWHQDSPGIKGAAQANDYFGTTVGGVAWS